MLELIQTLVDKLEQLDGTQLPEDTVAAVTALRVELATLLRSTDEIYVAYLPAHATGVSRASMLARELMRMPQSSLITASGAPIFVNTGDVRGIESVYGCSITTDGYAILRLRGGVIVEVIEDEDDVLEWLKTDLRAKDEDKPEKSRPVRAMIAQARKRRSKRKDTVACELFTDTGLVIKRKCCGGRIRERAVHVCPYEMPAHHAKCMRCRKRVAPGDPVPLEAQRRLDRNKERASKFIEAEIAAGRAVE